MTTELDRVYTEGLQYVDALELDKARAALEKCGELTDENAPEILHLNGMLAWADGDLEHAAGYLMQAADAGPSKPEVYLDCAELSMDLGEVDEAEAAIRVMLQIDGVEGIKADEGRLLLAQVRRYDDDPGEALEILDEVKSELRQHPYYHSARASVLLELGRAPEAVKELNISIGLEPDDADLRWELGVAATAAEDDGLAREAMLKAWELDAGEREPAEINEEVRSDLVAKFEAMLEDLPEELMKLLAGAPITVHQAPTREDVERGVDPRNPVSFAGDSATDDRAAKLTGISLHHALLVEAIDADEEIPDVLFHSLMVETRRFFRLESLTMVDVSE